VVAWASERGLPVVEDAAHALGATLGGRPVGALADGALFSLGRGKHLNTLGGGLAVVSLPAAKPALRRLAEQLAPPDAATLGRAVVMEALVEAGTMPALFSALAAPAIRLARRFGRDPMGALFEDSKEPLGGIAPALQVRLANLQARFGLASLAQFDRALARRREHAAAMSAALRDVLPLQQALAEADPAWLELTALVDDREAFQRALLASGVDTQRTWMDACDALPAFAGAGGGPCPVARDVARRAVYLPTYAALTEGERARVVAATRAAVGRGRG
jgi:dTDP-4-amino-4,6-dideoxygalactose transaminase